MPETDDIVQIVDDEHAWYPALLVVSEPRAWGAIAYCLIPESNAPGAQASRAFTRLQSEQFEVVGRAVVVPVDDRCPHGNTLKAGEDGPCGCRP